MKLWASAPLIGLSVAYLAVACSDAPKSDNTYTAPTGGTGTTGGTSATVAGTTATTGGMATTGGNGGSANPTGGTGVTAGAGGAGVTAGAGGTGVTAGAGGTGTGGGGAEVPCAAMVQGHCSEATYPTYPGYTLNLVEDFPAPLDLDTDPIFTWSDGSPADGQTGFRKENIGFAGGKMTLTAESMCPAKTTNSGCYPPRPMVYGEALAPGASASIPAMGVWSGELRSKYNNYRYGRYEAKFAAPIANPGQEGTDNMSGNYLSTLFIFRTPKNTVWNEIDVELEPWKHNQLSGNVLNIAGKTGYPGSPNANEFSVAGPANYAISQEHVYAFNWTPTKIEWFIDGTSVQSYTGTKPTVPIPALSSKIMMNLWIFSGNTFGDGANNKYPFKATYDYFRFYKLDTETKYPCTPVPGCLDAADKTVSSQNNPTEKNYGQ
jgi:Glycosyl hydrolases family 16